MGYRGEVMICYKNRTATVIRDNLADVITDFYETQPYNVENMLDDGRRVTKAPYEVGDRIAQLIIIPYPHIEFEEVDELSDSDRGTNGHGSTGR